MGKIEFKRDPKTGELFAYEDGKKIGEVFDEMGNNEESKEASKLLGVDVNDNRTKN